MLKAIAADLRAFLGRRRTAYVAVFGQKTLFTEEVLVDLARFCRAHRSTFHADPRVHALMEGRREVFLRILDHLKLSEEDLWKLYSGGNDG